MAGLGGASQIGFVRALGVGVEHKRKQRPVFADKAQIAFADGDQPVAALTFAAVILRLELPFSFAAGMDYAGASPYVAWLCRLPNLLVAEWMLRQGRGWTGGMA